MSQAILIQPVPLTRQSDQEEDEWPALHVRTTHPRNPPAVSFLHLQLLGGFRLACGDTSATGIDSPRLQSLLAYLVLHAGVPQSRTRLAALLWPDSTEAQAHTNLRNLLYKLRKMLPTAEELLRVDRHMLLWCNDGSWTLDVLDFERAVAYAEQAEREGALTTMRLALEQAIVRYQGELLPECYDEWVLPERERLFQVVLDVLERLLHLREQEGDYHGAIRMAQRLLREDPLQEATYRHLMRLYVRSGNRSAALRTYHTCAAVLERELGVEPASATRQAYEQLMQSEQFLTFATVKRAKNGSEASYAT